MILLKININVKEKMLIHFGGSLLWPRPLYKQHQNDMELGPNARVQIYQCLDVFVFQGYYVQRMVLHLVRMTG